MAKYDVIVVGAGVAGLAVLRDLDRSGLRVMVLEARDRVGGRIYTVHDPLSSLPLELGAEFVHGRPCELWNVIRDAGLSVYDGSDESLYMNQGQVERNADSWNLVGSVLNDMREAAKAGDQSFEEFLTQSKYDEDTRRAAHGYVEGFNAASANVISIQALAEETAAADEIDGDRVFRFSGGYDAVPLHLLNCVPDFQSKLRLNTVAELIEWQRGSVSIRTRNVLTNTVQTWSAIRSVITLPLGVLQAGTVAFAPEPVAALEAVRNLRFGQVFRVAFRFREAFWEAHDQFKDVGFILSREASFPTWWTTLSTRSTLLISWNAGARAEAMKGMQREEVLQLALTSLSRIMAMPIETIKAYLENVYFHDWYADPYAHGAYSYVPVNGLAARKQLAVPIEDTLYFAGEATSQNGHSATVHGALESGHRAARQVLGGSVVTNC